MKRQSVDLSFYLSRPKLNPTKVVVAMKGLAVMMCMAGLSACSPKPVQPLVDPKYKLSADRQALDDVRAKIPEGKREQNDELAYIPQLMESKRPPDVINDKFNAALDKKREVFNRDVDKRRELYVRQEQKDRDDFSKGAESARADFNVRKHTADERTAFYDDREQKRKDFYEGQRERRDEFEADVRDQRRNFEDYCREQNADFRQALREYTQRYDEAQRVKSSR